MQIRAIVRAAVLLAALASAAALYSSGGPVLILSKKNFRAEVLDSSLPALVEFYAPWCAPRCVPLAGKAPGCTAERPLWAVRSEVRSEQAA